MWCSTLGETPGSSAVDLTFPERRGLDGGALRVALHHPMRSWLDSMESLLASRRDVDLVAAHTSARWVTQAVMTCRADILVLHLACVDHTLAETLSHLMTANGRLRVVGLSESSEPKLMLTALRAGVRGWVEPTVSVDRLVATLHGVARGETWIPPSLLTSLLDTLLAAQQSQDELASAFSALTAREIDILGCLVDGMSRKEIADRYVLSVHTVRTHITNLLRKLGVHSVLAAVSLVRQIELPDLRDVPPDLRRPGASPCSRP
jgi:DNA-binding NarL/FixJ family response regulator